MNFKKSYKKTSGYTPICKIGECSLKMLEFGIIELENGEKITYNTEDKETVFILLEGYCTVKFNDEVWEHIGNRKTETRPDWTAHLMTLQYKKVI